ncbi:MAG: polysaccharide biosynthesis C-terminal domain-containing protein [Candidatus Baltobacteraceae bacterium]
MRYNPQSPAVLTPVAHGVLYDALFTLAARMFNVLGLLAVGVLTARALGPAGKGLYALPVVQAGIVSTIFAGLSSATSYYLLTGKAGRNVIAPSTIAMLLFVLASAIAVVPIAVLGHAFWAAPAAIASLPATALVNVVTGYVVGTKRVRAAATLALVTTAATFVFTVAGFVLVTRAPFVAIAAWIASTTLVAAGAWAIVLRDARRLERGSPVPVGAYARMALKVGATSLVTLLNYRADLYIVAILLPPAELGLYSVATSVPQSLLLPTQVAATVTTPHIGSLERGAAGRLAARCVRNNLLAALLLSAALFVFAPFLIELFYGAAFLPLVPALRILLIGVVALALGSPVSTYYTLKLAKPEVPLILAGASAAICIAASLVLVPRIGIQGAALASTAAYIVGQALGLIYFARSTGIAMRTILVPTYDDVRLYGTFLHQLYRDGARFFAPRLDPGAKTP